MKISSKFKSLWMRKIIPFFTRPGQKTDITIIFLLALGKIIEPVAQITALPIILSTNLIASALTIYYESKKDKHTKRDVSKAMLSVTVSLTIIVAVLLAFTGEVTVVSIAPYLLAGGLSLKALYELGSAAFCWYKYLKYKQDNPEKAQNYYNSAKENIVTFFASGLALGVIGGVISAKGAIVQTFSIIAGVSGISYAGYQAYKFHKLKKKAYLEYEKTHLTKDTTAPKHTNNAKLHESLKCRIRNKLKPHFYKLPEPDEIEKEKCPTIKFNQVKQSIFVANAPWVTHNMCALPVTFSI